MTRFLTREASHTPFMHLEESREYDEEDNSLNNKREMMMQMVMHESEQNQVTIDKRYNHFD